MNLALAKNKESWLKKMKETEELAHIAGPKDLKIQELEVCNINLQMLLNEYLLFIFVAPSSRINENSGRRGNRRSSNIQ